MLMFTKVIGNFSENYDKIVMYDFGYFYTVSNEYLIKNLSSAFLEIEPNEVT